MDNTSTSDALHYVIRDTDEKSETHDDAKVVYAEMVEPTVTRLELSGMTAQSLERYKIELKNIRDSAGNEILPNPKEPNETIADLVWQQRYYYLFSPDYSTHLT